MAAGRSCSPRTPSAPVPGLPYSATRKCCGKSSWPPPGSCRPVAAVWNFQSSPFSAPNPAPSATTVPGCCSPSSSTSSAELRGSVLPPVSCTRAPAAGAVATPARASGLPVVTTTVSSSGSARSTAGSSPSAASLPAGSVPAGSSAAGCSGSSPATAATASSAPTCCTSPSCSPVTSATASGAAGTATTSGPPSPPAPPSAAPTASTVVVPRRSSSPVSASAGPPPAGSSSSGTPRPVAAEAPSSVPAASPSRATTTTSARSNRARLVEAAEATGSSSATRVRRAAGAGGAPPAARSAPSPPAPPPVLGSATAAPARPVGPRTRLRRLGVDTGYAVLALPVAVAGFAVVVAGLAAGTGLLVVWVGVAVLAATLLAARGFAGIERAWLPAVLGTPLPRPAYRRAEGRAVRRRTTPLRDPQCWLDALHTVLRFPFALLAFVLTVTWWGVTLGGLTYGLWDWALPYGPENQDLLQLLGLPTGTGRRILAYTLIGAVFAVLLPLVVRGVALLQATLGRVLLTSRAATQAELGRLAEGRDAT